MPRLRRDDILIQPQWTKKSTSTVRVEACAVTLQLTKTEVLEIEKGASKIEIKKAYHKVRRQQTATHHY